MYRRASEQTYYDAVIHTVAEIGIENVRTKLIAQKTDLSEATMFNYFANKDDMLTKTFLEVDKRISSMVIRPSYLKNFETKPFEEAFYEMWSRVYRYLITHPDEVIYLRRFQYSALYTDEVRMQRMAYNGTFNKLYKLIEEQIGTPDGMYREFLVNYLLEMTLYFAERVIAGRLEDGEHSENLAWHMVRLNMRSFAEEEEAQIREVVS